MNKMSNEEREKFLNNFVANYFTGHKGQSDFQEALMQAVEFGRAQCSIEETVAAMASLYPAWPEGMAQAFCFVVAEEIEKAALAQKAIMRVEILRAARSETPSAARVTLLKEFAYQHLDWTRKPIDAETADALKEAEKQLRTGRRTAGGDDD